MPSLAPVSIGAVTRRGCCPFARTAGRPRRTACLLPLLALLAASHLGCSSARQGEPRGRAAAGAAATADTGASAAGGGTGVAGGPTAGVAAGSSRNVLTQHNDAQRTGATLGETTLSAAAVGGPQFGLLYTLPVTGDVYAQPLYVEDLAVAGGNHNVLVVATAHNVVYALDADAAPGAAPLWQVTLAPSVPIADFPGETNFQTEIGITATPVIDLASHSIYVSLATKSAAGTYAHQLHRLDLTTGAQLPNSPVVLTARGRGSGFGSVGGEVTLTEPTNLQRASLLLANGTVYLGFSAHGITSAYHGWLLAYDAVSLQPVGSFTSSPDSAAAGIWQGGQGPAVDANGFVYACSSNGAHSDATKERVESLLKFAQIPPAGMTLVDYFTPANWATLDANDQDFGSTGVLLVPGRSLALSGDKAGTLYFADTDALGKLQPGDPSLLQKVSMGQGTAFFAAPVYWAGPHGPRAYAWAQNDVLKAWDVGASTPPATPVDQAAVDGTVYMPGGILALSANGSAAGSGVLWATVALGGSASGRERAGALLAYDASDLQHRLFDSRTNAARDGLGTFGKFNPPTIANGRVYVGTFSNQVAVYGLRAAD